MKFFYLYSCYSLSQLDQDFPGQGNSNLPLLGIHDIFGGKFSLPPKVTLPFNLFDCQNFLSLMYFTDQNVDFIHGMGVPHYTESCFSAKMPLSVCA